MLSRHYAKLEFFLADRELRYVDTGGHTHAKIRAATRSNFVSVVQLIALENGGFKEKHECMPKNAM